MKFNIFSITIYTFRKVIALPSSIRASITVKPDICVWYCEFFMEPLVVAFCLTVFYVFLYWFLIKVHFKMYCVIDIQSYLR